MYTIISNTMLILPLVYMYILCSNNIRHTSPGPWGPYANVYMM